LLYRNCTDPIIELYMAQKAVRKVRQLLEDTGSMDAETWNVFSDISENLSFLITNLFTGGISYPIDMNNV